MNTTKQLYKKLTQAEKTIIEACIKDVARLGDDDAFEEMALVVEYEIGFADQGEARDLGAYIIRRAR
jgi:hypothetical protein